MIPEDLSRDSLISALDGARVAYFDGRMHETALVIAREVIAYVVCPWKLFLSHWIASVNDFKGWVMQNSFKSYFSINMANQFSILVINTFPKDYQLTIPMIEFKGSWASYFVEKDRSSFPIEYGVWTKISVCLHFSTFLVSDSCYFIPSLS